jgi:serine protease DegQ
LIGFVLMFKRLWLFFAQSVTVMLAALFVLAAFKPEWLPKHFGSSANNTQRNTSPSVPTRINETTNTANAPTTANPAPTQALLSYSTAASRAIPAVVNIVATKKSRLPSGHPLLDDPLFKRFFGDQLPPGAGGGQEQQRRTPGQGSGVIVKAEGLILTNFHVIDGAEELEVVLSDGRKAPAKVIGGDPDTDLAVIKIDLPNLQAITFGNTESTKIGDVVLAIGNPFGVGQTVTMGIVSALGRNQLGISTFENFIQTDAAINPGNSGGALVDSNGNLLGINSAIYSNSGGSLGIGFAIPLNIALPVMESIMKSGSVVRGYIGVEMQELNAELAKALGIKRTEGALIAGIVKNGPADKAGIKPRDLLISVAGKEIKNVRAMLDSISKLPPDKPEKFVFLRGDKEIEFEMVVGTRPKQIQARRSPPSEPE